MNDTKTKTETCLSDKPIIIVLLLRVRNSGFSRILSSTSRDHFSYLETHDVDGNFLLRSLHVLMLRVCSMTLVNFVWEKKKKKRKKKKKNTALTTNPISAHM